MKTCTVLTLGPSGAGKSTFINAMSNYVQYETLGDALEDDNPMVLVPIKFAQQRKNAKPIEIRMNGRNDHDVKNECNEETKSCTVNPRVHSFVFGNEMRLNVIDVPSINNTGGVVVDNRNRSAIMKILKEFDEIHSIWVFLSSDWVVFNGCLLYSLNDVFTVVPKSAIKNITFIFTKTRGYDYTSGDARENLQAFIRRLNQKHDLNINLDNCSYCVDSEAFRYLVGCHCNSDFRDSQRRLQGNYEMSWEESRNSLLKLLKKTFEFEGQNTGKFLTIHEARIAISCFFTAAAKIETIILESEDPSLVEEQKRSLMERFEIRNNVEVAKTNGPQTICAAKQVTNEDIEKFIKNRLEQLRIQKNEIYNTIHLAYEYLQQNSILPFNDRYEEKIKLGIRVNLMKQSDVIKNLEDLLEKHVEMMKQLEKFKEVRLQNKVSEKELKSAMEKLFKMPPYGPKIHEMFQTEKNVVDFKIVNFEPLIVDKLPEFENSET